LASTLLAATLALIAVLLLPVTLLAAFRSVNFVNVTTIAMKTRLALACLPRS
jgi:hypothetical protein